MIIYEAGCNTDIDQYRNLFLNKPEIESFEYLVMYDIDYFEDMFRVIPNLHEVENIREFMSEYLRCDKP